jgi:5'-nucleotidase / UDP-sugar diphosphatase
MKRILLIIVFSFLVTSCSTAPREGNVTILHTNDMHSQFVSLPATWVKKDVQPLVGGMVALEYFIRQARTQFPDALMLDAGDICTGTLLSKIDHNGALNGGFVEMMNIIDYDAFTIGNHEFDNGQDNLHALLNLAEFDVLSANLYADGKQIAPKAYEIYKVNGLRVGVIGLILSDLYQMTAKKNLGDIEVLDPAKTVQQVIDRIDSKTDLIIVLTHQGDDNDLELAQQIKNADIIVGGHSHTRIKKPRKENGILIVQAGSKTRDLGRLTVKVAGDTISSYDGELTTTWVDSVKEPNSAMQKLVNDFQQNIDSEYGQKIGTLKTAWKKHNNYETNIGNFISDVMREKTNTDVAFLNSGGIRKSMPAGPITKMDILEILPFSNYVVVFECTGQQIFDIVKNSIDQNVNGDSGILQLSGVECHYRVLNNQVEVTSFKIGGTEMQVNKIYRATTVDFVLSNLSGYTFNTIETTPILLSEMVMDYIVENPIVESRVEGRIKKN